MTPLVHVETSHDLPLVGIMVGFRAGATLDPPGREGLTRLAVRMPRLGAGGKNVVELANAIDGMGAELCEFAGLNAIHFHMDTIRRSFDRAVDLMASLLGDAAYDTQELARLIRETEQEVVEIRNFDRALCGRAFRRTLFRDHPFARRISGLPPSLQRIGRDDVVAHAKRMMNRSNVVFAFSGDVTDQEARAAAKRITDALPEAPAPSRPAVEPPGVSSRTLVFVDKPERSQTQTLLGCRGTHPKDPDHTAFVLGNTVFGGTFTSRLMTEVRVKRGWSYGACSNAPIDLCREAFSVWTHPDAKDVGPCLSLELELLERWRDRGVTGSELTFAKRHLSRSHAFEVDTASKRAQRRMLAMLYDLPPDYYDGFVSRLRSVTVKQANEAIRKRVDPSALVLAVTGTHDRSGADVEAAFANLGEVERVPYDLE